MFDPARLDINKCHIHVGVFWLTGWLGIPNSALHSGINYWSLREKPYKLAGDHQTLDA